MSQRLKLNIMKVIFKETFFLYEYEQNQSRDKKRTKI